MDLTNIDKPFGQLDIETKLALHRAFYEGKEIQWASRRNAEWAPSPEFCWLDYIIYRVKPEPMHDIELPWHVIRPEFKWAARDADGGVWVYNIEPWTESGEDCWSAFDSENWSKTICLDGIIHDPGNKPWNESLIQRPEGV